MVRNIAFNMTLLAFLAVPLTILAGQDERTAVTPGATVTTAGAATSSFSTVDNKDADRPELQRRNPRYIVALSDTLMVTFPLSPEYDETVTVQPDGFIGLRGVGDLHVAGLTLPELRQSIRDAYAKVLHDPIVSVNLTNFQKPYFVAIGQVGKPGQYELRDDITVTQAVAIAGGFTTEAKHSQVVLFRKISKDWAEVHQVDMKHMLYAKNLKEDVHLEPGDIVFVPQNFISKFKNVTPVGQIRPLIGQTGWAGIF